MKTSFIIILALLLIIKSHTADAQYLSLSYPIYNSVLQRNAANQAVVTIAGQLVWGTGSNGSIAPGTSVKYRIKSLNTNPVGVGPDINLPMSANGMFFTTTTLSKGWYLVEVLLNGSVFSASKVGVGDVFIIAGQSNAQGIGAEYEGMSPWTLPSTAGFPEWIVGLNSDYKCTKDLSDPQYDLYSLTDATKKYNNLGPTGNGVWCYAVLGKKISDANGGMPVAFFNAASGGSTVSQWYAGAQGLPAPNFYTGGNQFCLGHKGASPNVSDHYGQPYTPLRSALNTYASVHGVRAVLWHQGETDSDNIVPANYKATSAADYQSKLQFVMNKSRSDFGANASPNVLTWIVSKATISQNGPINNMIRSAQGGVVGGMNSAGPDTDYVTGSAGVTTATGYRKDQTHFEENYSGALSWLAGKWFDAIGNNGNKISGGFVPQLSYSTNGNKHILTAPAGYAEYRWGFGINSPIAGASTNVFTTETCQSGIRCFIKDSKGNWHVSPATWIKCYASNRIAAEDKQAISIEAPLAFNTYPNPFHKEFTIEFEVLSDGSNVKLELIDESGTVLKTITNNPHAKGKWKYFSGQLPADSRQVFCRLKVNELYTIKKLIKAD